MNSPRPHGDHAAHPREQARPAFGNDVTAIDAGGEWVLPELGVVRTLNA